MGRSGIDSFACRTHPVASKHSIGFLYEEMSEPDITNGTVCVFINAVADNDTALVLYNPLKQRSQLIDDRLASLFIRQELVILVSVVYGVL